MSHRYERVGENEEEDLDVHRLPEPNNNHVDPIPSSPPPSFRSRPTTPEPNAALADAFDSPGDDEDDDMRNIRSTHNANFTPESTPLVPQAQTTGNISRFLPSWGRATPSRTIGGGQTDAVFANLSAKPTAGEKTEEFPPTYEQAAADATPPYWETTILAPGMSSDEVFIDGLPVGSVFAFVWNALISMSFQLVGFLLTYLLHTTHAAKNGSRAGLGITLVQFGFMMRGQPEDDIASGSPPIETQPQDPNSYDFAGQSDTISSANTSSIGRNEWLSYVLMVVGWFILIRAVSDFLRARRTEQVVLASPDRGLGVAVVAEDESPERAV
ncbi:hypothetical protein EDC01DRAFT_715607 [Geopyxis carbonaria]|nr:hypothetical protein EDC01DRAFT_715607 [Geopyxis carbonaria]